MHIFTLPETTKPPHWSMTVIRARRVYAGILIATTLLLAAGCAVEAPAPPEVSASDLFTDTDAIEQVNGARAAADIRPLQPAEALTALAQRWAEAYNDGDTSWRDDFAGHLTEAGYASGQVAVLSGASAKDAVAQWLDDPETHNSLVDPGFGSVGFAAEADDSGRTTSVILVAYRADDGSLPLASVGAAEALDLTNAERAAFGLPPLTLSDDLNAAAQGQADHQAAILTMTHDGNGGLGNRLAEVGYPAGAENVAMGQRSVAEVVQGWIDSPGHHANIVNPDMREMGFAVTVGSDGRAYFAQVFGAR